MSVLHVSIEGLDRRSLTALGTRHRIVVVGHRENARTGKVTVDAYVTPRQEQWLKQHDYGVTRLRDRRLRTGATEGRSSRHREANRPRSLW